MMRPVGQKPCSDPDSACAQAQAGRGETKRVDPLSYDDKPDWQKPGYVGPMPKSEKVDSLWYDDKPADQKPCSDPDSACAQEQSR